MILSTLFLLHVFLVNYKSFKKAVACHRTSMELAAPHLHATCLLGRLTAHTGKMRSVSSFPTAIPHTPPPKEAWRRALLLSSPAYTTQHRIPRQTSSPPLLHHPYVCLALPIRAYHAVLRSLNLASMSWIHRPRAWTARLMVQIEVKYLWIFFTLRIRICICLKLLCVLLRTHERDVVTFVGLCCNYLSYDASVCEMLRMFWREAACMSYVFSRDFLWHLAFCCILVLYFLHTPIGFAAHSSFLDVMTIFV